MDQGDRLTLQLAMASSDSQRVMLAVIGIKELISARKSPWQDPFVKRVIGSTHREFTDHIIAHSERYLIKTLLNHQT